MKKVEVSYFVDTTAEKFLDLASQFQQSIAFLAAIELEIFNALGEDFKSADEIAEIINAPVRGTTRLLNFLVSLGVLQKSGTKYSNTKEGKMYLVKGNEKYLGNFKLFWFLINSWLQLPRVIKEGFNKNEHSLSKIPPEVIEGLMFIINWRANYQAPELVSYLDLSKVIKALDLGCGPGTFGLELLKKNINIDLTLFDFEEIIPFTQSYVERKGFTGLVNIKAGNFMTDDIGKDYDLVIVSNVLRLLSFKQCLNLLNKVFDALKRKGKIVVQETLFDNDRVNPKIAAIESMNLLLLTSEGDLLTQTEIVLLLKEAWFSDIKIIKTTYGSTIFIGER
ncbi:MAG: acetylserotonin O-methyltransferase [Ignavibacteria bacterium]|nr:acetylserotonin O-methyltransferase [Ignavibacteria bacterium]